MTIELPDDLSHYILGEIERGRFASEAEAIAEAVRVLRRDAPPPTASPSDPVADGGTPGIAAESKPIWEQVIDLMKDVPDSAFDMIPSDGSEQHDHYIYGTPKRPSR